MGINFFLSSYCVFVLFFCTILCPGHSFVLCCVCVFLLWVVGFMLCAFCPCFFLALWLVTIFLRTIVAMFFFSCCYYHSLISLFWIMGLFLYEDFWKMIFWPVLKLEIRSRVIISRRILVSFTGFCVLEDYILHVEIFKFP